MSIRPALAALMAGSVLLSGCVVAALPVIAAAGIGKNAMDGQDGKKRKASKRARQQAAPKPGQVIRTENGTAVITGLTALPPPSGAAPATAKPAVVPPEMQYLYGSGEGSAISLQAYRGLWNFLHNEIGYRRDKSQISSVVLSRGSTLTSPKFDLCGKRKLAVVLDVDETALLNLGFEYDAAAKPAPYDQSKWSRWEQTGAGKVVAVPGAADTLAAARNEGITVIFNSNRSTSSAAQTAAAIEAAGLGPAVLGDTLWLRDDGAPSGKDERRWKISETYCVVAMVGDQLGDFSDLFNTGEYSPAMRRNMTSESLLATLWGAGWFVLPNPVYGSALHGGLDEVFPKDKQWADPAEEKK
ncbi:HAD family acid phosphatase [Sphingomonas sp.]|uniref:HAD family acid phosphatase n=1 Tax=Sphingomonas sp. TaxID=28214 RepID=UPI0025D99EA9|nr:HAD family acid phosphatase [Sphingomonas sp.]